MTKILFFFDPQTVIFLEKDQSLPALTAALSKGEWHTFSPLDQLLSPSCTPESIRIQPFGSWLVVHLPESNDTKKGEIPMNVSLSTRQIQVLNYLSLGYTNKQIAHQLNLSLRTVNMHIAAIKRKLNTHTSAQSVARATALGYCRQVMRRKND